MIATLPKDKRDLVKTHYLEAVNRGQKPNRKLLRLWYQQAMNDEPLVRNSTEPSRTFLIPESGQKKHGGRRIGSGRKAANPGRPSNQSIGITLTSDIAARLTSEAQKSGQSRSEYVRSIIEAHFR